MNSIRNMPVGFNPRANVGRTTDYPTPGALPSLEGDRITWRQPEPARAEAKPVNNGLVSKVAEVGNAGFNAIALPMLLLIPGGLALLPFFQGLKKK
jgi:hypothetical protein